MKKLFSFALCAFLFINSFAAVTITPASSALPGANIMHTYTVTFQAQGGTKPYTWTKPAGTLPPGLLLNSGSQLNATISGIPTTAGTYTFTIRATDKNGSVATNSYTIAVTQVVFTPAQATTVWCRSTPDCPNIWDTWNSFLSATTTVIPTFANATLTTQVTQNDTVLFKHGTTVYKSTRSNFDNIIGTFNMRATTGWSMDANSGQGIFSSNSNGDIILQGGSTSGGRITMGTLLVTTTQQDITIAPFAGRATFISRGNLCIGTTGATAKVSVMSSGNTSGTDALTIVNSSSTELLGLSDNGRLRINAGGFSTLNVGGGSAFLATSTGGPDMQFTTTGGSDLKLNFAGLLYLNGATISSTTTSGVGFSTPNFSVSNGGINLSTSASNDFRITMVTGDYKMNFNTDKYLLTIFAASGNFVETIAGGESKTIIGASTETSTALKTFTTGLMSMPNLPTYANNAAALAGGLGVGYFYLVVDAVTGSKAIEVVQ